MRLVKSINKVVATALAITMVIGSSSFVSAETVNPDRIAVPLANEPRATAAIENLVVQYEFDQINGKVLKDSSGNGHTAQITGDVVSPLYLKGKYNSGIQFNNPSDTNHISMGTSSAYKPANMTIAWWSKRTKAVSGEAVLGWAKGAYDANNGWYINSNASNALGFRSNGSNHTAMGGNYASRNTFWPTNEWVHTAITVNSTSQEVKFYRNGELVFTSPNTTNNRHTIIANNNETMLMKNYYGTYTDGWALDDFRIYNTDLSRTDIAAVMNDGAAPVDQVSITLDANGGTVGSGTAQTVQIPIGRGDKISLALQDIKAGKIGNKFDKWQYENGTAVNADDIVSSDVTIKAVWKEGHQPVIKNDYFDIYIGDYGNIENLKIVGDLFPTNYVMNPTSAPSQNIPEHQWMGELIFSYKKQGDSAFKEVMTSKSDDVRAIRSDTDDKAITVTYDTPSANSAGIKDFSVNEKFSLVDDYFKWDITVKNTSNTNLEIGDFGLPLPFNEIWEGPNRGQAYETRVLFHSFTGKDSSYIYVNRPSGQGQFLLMVPDTDTGAGFEYQDQWVSQERGSNAWSRDVDVSPSRWANGLNVFYIHSNDIKKTGRGYLENTSLDLTPGAEKTYSFKFYAVQDEADMYSKLYDHNIINATAVPGMIISNDTTGLVDLPTTANITGFEIKCIHEYNPYEGLRNSSSNNLPHTKTDENTYIKLKETKLLADGIHNIYEIKMEELGHHTVIVNYEVNGVAKQTVLQFYSIEPVGDALARHAEFLLKTQWNVPGNFRDKVFDTWMMNTKAKRNSFAGYWGWGDDWGYTHAQYLAEWNVYNPDVTQIKALDEYLDVAIWNSLMKEHQDGAGSDAYLIHDFLMADPNTTPTYRGFAYPHIYNTYFSMYQIAKLYPDMIDYAETKETYLLRAYNIMNRLYGSGVSYNRSTGLMGEMTTPDIIAALQEEGFVTEADRIISLMNTKYNNFRTLAYPYGSEYVYDNTGEEAVYMLAKENGNKDMMKKIDLKTRACRGLQPIWYFYANPVTINGENLWQFQYTIASAGYAMDDWLRVQNNGYSDDEKALAQRLNYAAKVGAVSTINSGQISAEPENIGSTAWTYTGTKGHLGSREHISGPMQNGWGVSSGEAGLGLFFAIKILSADIAIDPVFGLVGYGCDVEDLGNSYKVVPKDGVFKKLNLINEGIYMELAQDQYTEATVNKDGAGIAFTLKNVSATAHNSSVTLTGMKPGNYGVYVDGVKVLTFETINGDSTTVKIPVSDAASSKIIITDGDIEQVVPADKTQLTALLEQIREMDKDIYTIESWEVVEALIENAELIEANEMAEQDDVDAIVSQLQEALASLVVYVPVAGIKIGQAGIITVKMDKSIQLTAAIAPADATDTGIEWVSSNAKLAAVDENGVVTGLSKGMTTIKAISADGGYTAVATIKVEP